MSTKISYKAQMSCKKLDSFFGVQKVDKIEKEEEKIKAAQAAEAEEREKQKAEEDAKAEAAVKLGLVFEQDKPLAFAH